MKKILLVLLLFLTVSCGICHKVKYVPTETKRDSVYIEKIVERVDTLKIDIPGEKVYVIQQDSSHIETTVAISDAKIDEKGFLHHSLVNKDVSLEKEIVYKDRIIEKKVEVEKEVPVEVEVPVKYVPGYYKWINIIFWCLVGLIGLFVGLKIYFKR